MDELYDNLDNYDEEYRISELQTENNELKLQLEEYASTLDKLQKDFGKLTSEYKRLELNYSSLLKTAKAEIERKTQIIANLNLEKDKMVLKSFQNKGSANNRSSRYEKQTSAQNCKEDKSSKSERDSKLKEAECSRHSSSKVTTKESVDVNAFDINDKDLVSTGHARADSREKSDNYQICDEKYFASTHTSREPSRENTEKKHTDHYSERRSSRFSEAFSLQDRYSRYQEPDGHKSRHSRYESEKTDRYRSRDKSSHRHKKPSPDRHKRRSKDNHDKFYHRSEYDKQRPERRVHDSPPKNKNHWRPSHEHNRNIYEKEHLHEYEKVPHKNHERYPIKHKIQHGFDESDSKRMRIEPHFKQYEEEQRLNEEKDFLEKKLSMESIDTQFSTCESPDFIHPDISGHQIREIKLTATTKLDDPRVSNKKYVLKQNNGKVTLVTVESENVDLLPISKTAWGIKNITIPEALVKRPPMEIEQSAKAIQIEIENPLGNISIESGEICDSEVISSQNLPKEIENRCKLPERTIKTSIINLHNTKDIEKFSQKNSSYKIPKLKKLDNQQNRKECKEIATLDNLVDGNTSDFKGMETTQNTIRDNDIIKQPVEENSLASENKQGNTFIQSDNELPNLSKDIYNERTHLTAKEVVEGDLELSDDNCDNDDQSPYIRMDNITTIQLENKQKDKDEGFKIDTKKHLPDAGKKVKNKKKSKGKEPKDECKNKDPQLTEIDTRKKDNVIKTKTEQIKTKFSELFDDSSSLISPEDLGLTSVPAFTAQVPEKCVQFFEDALDAADVNAITSTKDLIPSENRRDIDNAIKTNANIACVSQDSVAKIDEKLPEITKDVIVNVYKNLEPGMAKIEETVKTVIISTGIQPQVEVQDENQEHISKSEQQRVASREIALKALATSTPYKTGQSDIVSNNIGVIPDSSCNSNDSQLPIIENSTALDNSNSNTLESQTNGDVPDVRIFVRRKRKIIKK